MEKEPNLDGKRTANQALDNLVSKLASKGIDMNTLPINDVRFGIKGGANEDRKRANQGLDELVKALNDNGEDLQSLSEDITTIRHTFSK